MNQILITSNNNEHYVYNSISFKTKKSRKKFILIFSISLTLSILISIYLVSSYLLKIKELKKADVIKEKYNITTLYASNTQYNAIKLSNNMEIIGLVEIPKINISYPIFSKSNADLLKISVCRFSGPLPNRNGNLCIAGHNYRNKMMFSNLQDLNINDSIFITDLNSTKLEYVIYKKYKSKENDLNCTNNTLEPQITLITCCDYNNQERIIIKAKVKG